MANDPHHHVDHVDGHGVEHHDDDHHEHHVIAWPILVGILIVLLFFTMLTVNTAQAEVWFAGAFDVHIPTLVNVFVAMSIATVKAWLVCMYFMGLKYDTNPLNGIVILFTLFCLAMFLGFTAIDLGNRDGNERYKSGEIVAGGVGGPHTINNGMNMVDMAKQNKIEELAMKEAKANGREAPSDEDMTVALDKFWTAHYGHITKIAKLKRNSYDVDNRFASLGFEKLAKGVKSGVIDYLPKTEHEKGVYHVGAELPAGAIKRTGLTKGLFDAHDAHDDHGHDHGDHDHDNADHDANTDSNTDTDTHDDHAEGAHSMSDGSGDHGG
jgi:cytochrome c oxidase subunit 4